MKLGDTLKRFRKAKGLTTLELATKAGVGLGTVGDIERGAKGSTAKTLDKIANALNLDMKERVELFKYLMPQDIADKISRTSNINFVDEELIRLEVQATASAGCGCLNFIKNGKKIYLNKNGFDERCYLVEVLGDSMEPEIPDGAFVVVDPRKIELTDGKVYIVKFDDEIFIKRVFRNYDIQAIILKSVNHKYKDVFITKDRLESFEIIGQAVQLFFSIKL